MHQAESQSSAQEEEEVMEGKKREEEAESCSEEGSGSEGDVESEEGGEEWVARTRQKVRASRHKEPGELVQELC